MASKRVLRSTTRKNQEKENNFKETENETGSETNFEISSSESGNGTPTKRNKSPTPLSSRVRELQDTIEKQQTVMRSLIELISPEKLKQAGFNKTVPPQNRASRKATENSSLPTERTKGNNKSEILENEGSGLQNSKTIGKTSILQQYLGTIGKTVVDKEKSTEKSKDGTFDINSFLATNSELLKSRKELMDYDDFLRKEREKLREKQKALEIEHREMVREKYKPSAHSSLNKNDSDENSSVLGIENFMDNYLEKVKRKNEKKRQTVQFKEKSKEKELNYEWPEDSTVENKTKLESTEKIGHQRKTEKQINREFSSDEDFSENFKSQKNRNRRKNVRKNYDQGFDKRDNASRCDTSEHYSTSNQCNRELSEKEKELDRLNSEIEKLKNLKEKLSKSENSNKEKSRENPRSRLFEQEHFQDDRNQQLGNFTNPFPFGMIQTPFQIMSNWPVKFRNNKVDNPVQFLEELIRFSRGYKISESNVLENIDAVLADEALEWCRTVRNNWYSFREFRDEFQRTFMDEKYVEEITTKIKFNNQKEGEEIQTFLIGIRKLFGKLFPRKSLQWELRRAYENLRIEYKMYIQRNDFETFEELESLGKEFEIERNKSKIRGQSLNITAEKKENPNVRDDKQKQPMLQQRSNMNFRGFGENRRFPPRFFENYFNRNWTNNQPKITFPSETPIENNRGQKMLENTPEKKVESKVQLQIAIPKHSSAGNGNTGKATPENQKQFSKPPRRCYGCGQLGHFRRDCPAQIPENIESPES